MISQSPFIFMGSKSDLSLTLSDPTTLSRYAFRANGTAYGQLCKSVTEIKSDTITEVDDYGFFGCSVLERVSLPNVLTLRQYALGLNNTSESNTSPMTSLDLPRVQLIETRAFQYRQQLESVTLGSPGNPVSEIGSNPFYYCTQNGLVITVYTTGGASLSGAPWGATNATVNFVEA